MKTKLTIGEFIKLLLQHQYKKTSDGSENFKKFIEKCASIADFTSRQIDRLMRLDDFPNKTAIASLSKAVPDINIFDPKTVSHRLLLHFSSISKIQSELHSKHGNLKITIVAGWSIPQALVDGRIALTLAENIYSGISYEFIYPSIYDHPQLLGGKKIVSFEEANFFLKEKLKELFDIVENKILELDKSNDDKLKRMEKAMQKARDNIVFVSTYSKKLEQSKIQDKSNKKNKCESETVLFWLLMPSKYAVFYNLGGAGEKDSFSKGGSLMVTGKVVTDNDIGQDLESNGWLHISSTEYQEIENEYNKFRESWEEIMIE
jgi:hypothetical protein